MLYEELKEEMLLAAACSMYGSCMESSACESMVVEMLMEEFALDDWEAEAVFRTVRSEWMEAYS